RARVSRWRDRVADAALRRAEGNCPHASPAGQDRCRGGGPTARRLCRLTFVVVQNGAIAVLDARRMGLDDQAAAVGVDQRVTLAPVDLFARIVTAWAAGLGGLDALAVDDRGRGAGVAPDPLAICHHKRVVYPFKAPIVAPGGEPAVDRPPRR